MSNKLYKLYSLQLGICFYCRRVVSPEKATIDHKEPLSKGGRNNAENRVMSCLSCNNKKGDLPFMVFMQRNYPWRLSYPQEYVA